MTKTIWVSTSTATTYVPREKPIQESLAPFSSAFSGAVPSTLIRADNTGQRILAIDGTWIPQPAFTSGGSDQIETLRPSVISPSYSGNPGNPSVIDPEKAYDSDTNHATTFGQWYAAPIVRTNNRVDIFSLTTWASKTQTWTAATINVSRSYATLQDGESSATSGSSSKTSSVKYEFSTDNGSNWTTLGTDTAASIPTAPQTLSMALGSLTPTMGNILVKVTITRGGGGTIFEDGVSLPGLTGEVDLKLFDVWIDGTYAGGAGNITCNNLTVTGDATFQNKIYDSTASAGTTGQVLKVLSNGKVGWQTDTVGTGTVTSVGVSGSNGISVTNSPITTSGTIALALGNITPTSISTGTGSFSGDVAFASSITTPSGSSAPVVIAPDGGGDLHINTDSIRFGYANSNSTLATRGTGDLILTTHEGSTTEGVIRLYDGANGNITLTPYGTGQVQVGSDQVVTLTASQTLTNKTLSTSSTWNGNTIGVAYGGTGSTTLTSGSYVVGNGTSAVTLKTPTQVTADLDTFTYQIGGTAGKKGLVPAAPAIGASVVYLDQTGSWTTPSGSGTTTNALNISSPLTGTSFNGSTAVTIALASGYGDTQNPYGSKTANYFLASPNGTAGSPTFRAIVAADIPTLNQSTTGNAATASALQTARNINGVSFNGTADITVTAAANTLTGTTLASGVTASSLTSVGTLTGLTVNGNISANALKGTSTSYNVPNFIAPRVSDDNWSFGIHSDDSSTYFMQVKYDGANSATRGFRLYDVGTSSVPFLVTGQGNVGIGTSSPSSGLDVRKTPYATSSENGISLGFSSGSSTVAKISFETDSGGVPDLSLKAPNDGNARIKFYTGSTPTERMRIDSSGNLSLGFAGSPYNSAKMEIYRATAGDALMLASPQGTGNSNAIAWTNSRGDVVSARIYNIDDGNYGASIVFGNRTGQGTTTTERMRIDSSGNLGIGTSSPSNKLHIAAAGLDISGGIAVDGSTMQGIRLQNTVNTNSSLGIWFGTNNVHWCGISGQRSNYASTWGTDLRFYTHEDATSNLTYSTERMRIDSSGNVGIGVTPSGTYGKLTVNGGLRTTDDSNSKLEIGRYSSGASNSYIKLGANSNSLRFTNANDSVDLMTLDNSGNLGLGTSSPAQKLEVSTSGTSAIQITSTSGTAQLMLNPSGSNAAYINYNRSSASVLAFYDHNASAERMRITSGGDVLVNATATADSSKLYVAGNLGTNGSQFNFRPGSGTYYELVNRVGAGFDFYVNNAGTLAARIDSSGNLLIGNTNGTEKLTVTGNIRASGVYVGNGSTGSYTKGFGAIQTSSSTPATPSGGAAGDHFYYY